MRTIKVTHLIYLKEIATFNLIRSLKHAQWFILGCLASTVNPYRGKCSSVPSVDF